MTEPKTGLHGALPEEVGDYLRAVRDLNHGRIRTLRDELVRVIAALNAIGVAPQLLKGATALLPVFW